jgi:thiosulfate dehydrogenase (quinone) large subunit
LTATIDTPTTLSTNTGGAAPDGPTVRAFGPSWLTGAAIVRILFGIVWSIDAVFKWLPGFIGGQTLGHELGKSAEIQIPVVHGWLQLWNIVGLADPHAFAVGIAIVESVLALLVLTGAFSNVAFLGTALLSAGIWSGAEGFHLPWGSDGQTDLGPSVGYIIASLALFYAVAGSRWSIDVWLRPRLGRAGWLASPSIKRVTLELR